MNALSLPWPPKELMKNSRAHGMRIWRTGRGYRATCATLAMAEGWHRLNLPQAELPMIITFYPPDKRKRDRHNMPVAMAYGIDGLQDALGVDDNHFRITWGWGDPVKGGRVLVELAA